MWCMAVITGISKLVLEFIRLIPLESCFVALPANVALLALEQPFIISGMGRMTGHAAVVPETNKMVMG